MTFPQTQRDEKIKQISEVIPESDEGFKNKWLQSQHRRNKTKTIGPTISQLKSYLAPTEGAKLFLFISHSVPICFFLSFHLHLLPFIHSSDGFHSFLLCSHLESKICDSFVSRIWNHGKHSIRRAEPLRWSVSEPLEPLEPLEVSPALTDKDVHLERNICRGESKTLWGESALETPQEFCFPPALEK